MAKHVRVCDADRNQFLPTMDEPATAGYIHLTDGTNVLSVYPSGALKMTDTADGPVGPGTAAVNSQLSGGVYNPDNISMTSGQQAALQLDARGYLKTTLADTNSEASTLNSTTTPLVGNGTFTGVSEEVKDYASIVIQVYSSHASATNGMQIQFSTDNSNWDRIVSYTVPAGTGKSFVEIPRARYMRLVYTNGSTLQTAFRLQTIFHYNAVNSRHTTLDQTLNTNDLAVLTRGLLTNGTYNVDVSSSGALKMTDTADGPVGPGSAAVNSQLAGGVYNPNDVTMTSGQQAALQLDARGYLKTTLADTNSEVSVNNSTTTSLSGNGTFTGVGEEVKDYASIVIQVYSSHASATNGMQIQFSTDNSNWDRIVSYTVPAGTGKSFVEIPRARYMRLVYTNGATLQTAFRLQTIFHYNAVNSRHTTLDQTLNTNDLAVLTRGLLTNGTYNVDVSSSGALKMIDTADGPVGPGTAAVNSQLSGGVYNPDNITMTSGQQAALQLDARGYLKTTLADTNSDVSVNNSTITPLVGNGTFTGVGEEVKDYASIVIQVYSSHASAANGMQIQFSTDNSNWDRVVSYTVPAGIGKSFVEIPRARYMRIVYTNGSTLQSAFRLQTIFHYNAVNSRHTTLDQTLTTNDTAVLTRGLLTNGTYNVDVSSSGALKMTDTADGTVAPGTAAVNSQLAGGVYNPNDVTMTSGQQAALQLDQRGYLKTTVADEVSTSNSTATPLSANGVFTGVGEDVRDFASIVIQVFSSHASAPNGMQIQFSIDNSNWDRIISYTVPAGIGKSFVEIPRARYMRIVYTNGATLQTAFRMQTVFHFNAVNSRHTTLDQLINNDDNAVLTRGLLTNGTYNADVYSTNALKVTDTADGPVNPGTQAANSQLAGAVYNSAGIALLNTQQSSMQLDNTGNLKVTVSGAILANPVAGASVLSTVNSTSTPLAANGVFTGAGELCIDYASIVIQVYSSHASATGGLQVQFSSNNSNWDKSVVYTITATRPENYIEFPRARYMRIVYTNGGTLQTTFRLQTIFHYSPVNPRHTTLDADLNSYETCLLGRSAICGFDPTTNAPYNAKVNSAGQLLVATAGAAGPSTTEATESFSKRAYQTTTTIQLPTTTEYALLLFNNPTGSGKTVYIRNITFANTTGANKSVTLKVYSAPTVTSIGTALTPTTMFVGSNAPATATTVTYNLIGLQGNQNVTQTMTVTNFGTALSTMVATNETSNIDYNWGLLVSANNRILVTGIASANNQNTTVNIIWTEV